MGTGLTLVFIWRVGGGGRQLPRGAVLLLSGRLHWELLVGVSRILSTVVGLDLYGVKDDELGKIRVRVFVFFAG